MRFMPNGFIQMMHRNPSTIRWNARAACFVVLLFLCAFSPAAEPYMRLRLKDGSFAVGRVVPSALPDTIGWQCDGLQDPFLFEIGAVRSITLIADENQAPAAMQQAQFFELQDGVMVAGALKAMDDEWLTIDSSLLGEIQVERGRVISLIDAGYAGDLIYSGPRDDKQWRSGDDANQTQGWELEAGALVAKRPGIAISGDVNLPDKSQISVILSWQGAPDFVFSFGTQPGKTPSASEPVGAAARLEVWDKQLALLREAGDLADIELLTELSPSSPRVELTVYLDQPAGVVIVCDAHGRPLDRMVLPVKDTKVQPSVQLVNHGPSLTLERFEVRAWDGLTTVGGAGSGIVLADSDEPLQATIKGYDAETRELQLQTSQGEERSLPIAQLRRGDFYPFPRPRASVPPKAASRDTSAKPTQAAGDASAASDKPESSAVVRKSANDLAAQAAGLFGTADAPPASANTDPTQASVVEVVWADRTRLKGRWLPSKDGKLQFAAESIARPVQFTPAQIRGLIGTEQAYSSDLGQLKRGTLKIDQSELSGYLEDNTPGDSSAVLLWHPLGSRNASGISDDAVGAIVYRQPLPQISPASEKPQQPDPIVAPMVRIFLGGEMPKPRTANDANPTNASDSRANANDEREIVFRSGDAINGLVRSIDESGLVFESSETQTTRASHDQMQSVWLNRQRRQLEVSPEKLNRLMTVPRSMKSDPPTHLFISVLGDFLRGRLVSLDENKIVAEVRLEMVELPRDQVAQIIWLHDRGWSKAEQATESDDAEPDSANEPVEHASKGRFLVHAIKATDRGLTFHPQQMREGLLSGTSELLGACAVEISTLNQLLFGRNVADQVREFKEDPWKLSLAQYPRVFLEEELGGDVGLGSASPLVGEPAIDFGLKTLDGESFRLSKSHDRILVLDFWASWCGPCIQTMPLVEEVVQDIGADKVHLVAVNIQEAPARVQAAVDRLGMSSTVLLDRDGQAAAAYAANAIPQTVIINKQGVVTHVFVGGGPKFITQFRKALEELAE